MNHTNRPVWYDPVLYGAASVVLCQMAAEYDSQ